MSSIHSPPESKNTVVKSHLRGSSLMLIGRLLAIGINLVVQLLIVRYLAKSDYGAFAYGLAVASMGSSFVLLGLNRAVSRFVPIFEEQRDYASMFGTMLLALVTITGVGLALVCLTMGLRGVLAGHVVSDPLSLSLLMVLIGLAPLQALDNAFQGLLAVFASPRAIFWRRHILGPSLKLVAILFVIQTSGDVHLLAHAYLVTGILGVAMYVWLLWRVLAARGLLKRFSPRRLQLRAGEIFRYSLPLISTDVFLVLKSTLALILLEYFRGTTEVASLRAVIPVAGLNLIGLQSLKLLYVPMASRLYARNDEVSLNDLYWKSAVWITVLSFPVFAVCFFLADPLTVLLFGAEYADSGLLLAILAVGNYVNAALGMNSHTLQVYARVRFITWTSLFSVAMSLLLSVLLIPRFGAIGAAVGISGALIAHNLLNHVGMLFRTGIRVFDSRYLRVYLRIGVVIAALVLLNTYLVLPTLAWVVAVVLAAAYVLWTNFRVMDIASTFPEMTRIPIVGKYLGERTR